MKVYAKVVCGAILIAVFSASGCSSTKNYERAYRRAWRKIVNSQAWKDALVPDRSETADNSGVFYPLPNKLRNTSLLAGDERIMDKEFLDHYQSLVFRAYFRTIAEAEKADSRIYDAYRRLLEKKGNPENRNDKAYQESLQLAKTRYRAHRKMLDGLRSWKSFSDYGSDDLDFFLKEHYLHAYEMQQQGKSDEHILRYLVYRLADLYHLEEEEP